MDIISEIWGRILSEKKDIRDVESEDFLDDFDLWDRGIRNGRIDGSSDRQTLTRNSMAHGDWD